MKNNTDIENNNNNYLTYGKNNDTNNNSNINRESESKKLNNQNDNNDDDKKDNYNSIDQNKNYSEIHDDEIVPKLIEKDLRRAFIQKVFAILSLQLLISIVFCILSASIPNLANLQSENTALLHISIAMAIGLMLYLVCFKKSAKQYPRNYILLLAFTACEAYIMAYICVTTNPHTFFMVLTITILIVISLILYAFYTKTDFTGNSQYLFICAFIMLLCGIFLTFTKNKLWHVIFSGIGVLLYSIYLLYDVQLLCGNASASASKLDYDDYIIGCLMLYVDIVHVFSNCVNKMR